MVKNTGPDLAKIADTLRHFGPGFDYVVTAYSPFLKHLRDRLDAEGFPWPEYRISGLVGGEGMTEALRDYLEERFRKVRSSYRAGQCAAVHGVVRAARGGPPGTEPCLGRDGLLLDVLPA
jgi:phenylacetate-coenzyme A ligase PaaK-like adenylate-forming protein